MITVAADAESAELWEKIGDLAESLDATQDWCLIGGLMVQLHAFERGAPTRPTTDVDILGDAGHRSKRSVTSHVSQTLNDLGGKLVHPSIVEPQKAYRFEFDDGTIVDVLGPDGRNRKLPTLGKNYTIDVPGGAQALQRTEQVEIVLPSGRRTVLRRPNLLGAILLKARSLEVHSRPEDQRVDLLRLLSLVDDTRALEAEITGNERKWLRGAANRLDVDDPRLRAQFSAEDLRRAENALRLLVR